MMGTHASRCIDIRASLLLGVAAVAAWAGSSSTVSAQVAQVSINVPAQPLAASLMQIGRQARAEIIYAATDVRGLRATAVQGARSTEEALRLALRGTGLAVRRTAQGAFLIEAATYGIAAAPALAQQSGTLAVESEARDAGDIIVTARRSEERLQDVPISITVFTQEQINNRNIVNTADLAAYTPSLSVNSRFGAEKASFAIRGFVQETNTSPSVGVYFADVAAPRSAGGTPGGNGVGVGALFDLENVQVLKGPQGTLFGRNTTGGAVLLVPRRPTDSLEGYAEISLGDYDLRRGQSVINIPVAETFKVRLGVDRQTRKGYQRNYSGVGPDRFGDVDYWAFRGSIVANLTPDLENYFIASFTKSDTNGTVPRIVLCDRAAATPGGAPVPIRSQTARLGCAQLDRQNARGDNLWDIESGHPDPFLRLRQWQVINTTTWRASDTLTVKNIVSYGEYRERGALSIAGDNFVLLPGQPGAGSRYNFQQLFPSANQDNSSQSTFTEELQFQGESGALRWQAGGYLEVSSPIGISAGNTFTLSCTDPINLLCFSPFGASGTASYPQTKTTFNNKGIYAQASYDLNDVLTLTGGLRYTWDRASQYTQTTRIRFPAPNRPEYICTDTLRFQAPGGGPLVVANPVQCGQTFRVSSEKPTWLINMDYKPVEDVMLYAKYARGYRAGGIASSYIGLETWGPEKVDAYEVGAKASFRGAVSGYFNIAGFYNDFSEQQLAAGLIPRPSSGLAGGLAIINAGKSRIYGVEVDSGVTLFDTMRLELGYTYLSTKLQSIIIPTLPPESPFSQVTPTAQAGEQLALSPKHRVTTTATYTLPLDERLGSFSVGATYVYTAKQVAVLSSPLGILPETHLLNLNANWGGVGGSPVDLAFFMTNVTNKAYPVNVTNGYRSAGFDAYILNQPRMWGVRLRYSFGD
ncbi:TonB-dependent receptor domain-containing protein [Novosphingobium sp. M1R2S20]|uniref:TonB-dependent receptor n=1 Tax=Novosphingobium rhizovicinum TaxID=3228928 RepID=A0ABV3RFT0_9SPHN